MVVMALVVGGVSEVVINRTAINSRFGTEIKEFRGSLIFIWCSEPASAGCMRRYKSCSSSDLIEGLLRSVKEDIRVNVFFRERATC